jgi:D-alanyl-D-alanine carboxypeptidase/D-alanyl-D-alanine-endopeptidase (penicillin-binding protein 4)
VPPGFSSFTTLPIPETALSQEGLRRGHRYPRGPLLFYRTMRRLLAVACALAALAPPAAAAADASLNRALSSAMRGAGRSSGAFVLNATDRDVLFQSRAGTQRILASNTKIFTTAAALGQIGTQGTLPTVVLGDGQRDPAGVWQGDLYLKGGGDPTFGSGTFIRRAYGNGADIGSLADQLEASGVTQVRGRILGDESRFDSLRGVPDSGFAVSRDVGGPLSGLAFNRGLASERGYSFQLNPPAFAAARLDDALEARGISVTRSPAAGPAPPGAVQLAAVESPQMSTLVRLTNKDSDNFFAEMLLKDVAASASGRGTTRAGARVAAAFARRLGARARLVDGSGLSRGNRASPRQVAEILDELRERNEFQAFFDSLPVAGRDGTLRDRMRRGAARTRCRAKTGTLSNVSALSGYCESRSGDTIVFSFLMNAVSPVGARRLQDRMTQELARIDG